MTMISIQELAEIINLLDNPAETGDIAWPVPIGGLKSLVDILAKKIADKIDDETVKETFKIALSNGVLQGWVLNNLTLIQTQNIVNHINYIQKLQLEIQNEELYQSESENQYAFFLLMKQIEQKHLQNIQDSLNDNLIFQYDEEGLAWLLDVLENFSQNKGNNSILTHMSTASIIFSSAEDDAPPLGKISQIPLPPLVQKIVDQYLAMLKEIIDTLFGPVQSEPMQCLGILLMLQAEVNKKQPSTRVDRFIIEAWKGHLQTRIASEKLRLRQWAPPLTDGLPEQQQSEQETDDSMAVDDLAGPVAHQQSNSSVILFARAKRSSVELQESDSKISRPSSLYSAT